MDNQKKKTGLPKWAQDWFEQYEAWYKEYTETSTQDDDDTGPNPGPPPPPPPIPGNG